ncbi:ABC transporter permease [Oceanobacillus piezotolerans]|uniref:ABC transporter permease n=2 Tax=Oceanobacillus piezotolerans TaxID=2448030 RepID=A0A498D758_9BACI|nr:ABC transporter permease [Oceanobacillus piezotolerans]RLL45499.1 ABC transporter permease [Oceanobacillus piezotolerans]
MKSAQSVFVLPFRTLKNAFKKMIIILLFAVIWEVAPRIGLVDAIFLPPLSEVLVAWFELIRSGDLFTHFSASITRSFLGFILAIAIAIPLGLMIGWYPIVHELFSPILELFRNTAALALLPVFILILGIGETSKVAIILFACLWPLLLNTINAVRNVDPLLIKCAKSMNLTSFQLFYKVIIPASVPTIFTGIRLAGTSSILVLIAAEMVGAKEGLGFFISYTQFNFQIAEMYAGIITISLLGLLLNQLLVSLEKRFSRWKSV